MESTTTKLINGQVLIIRQATTADVSDILDFIKLISEESNFLTFGPGEFDYNKEQEIEFITHQQNSVNQIFLIATIKTEVVGTLIFSSKNRPRIQHSGEFSMAVGKQYWGLGIGSRLVDHLITWAVSTNRITKINLRVRSDNHRAIKLYEQKGFVKEGHLRKEIFLEGKYYDLLWMGLEI